MNARYITFLLVGCWLMLVAVAGHLAARTITIRLGYQDMCTDTYPAGNVIMGLHLLRKYLPTTGRYAGVHYRIVWRNYDSGAPLTNMMIAGKLDFGTMGDYPLVVNGAKFQATGTEKSLLVTMTAYNLDGAGNGIVVPTSSKITSVTQLEGKKLSVPIGSAAWGMLYLLAKDRHIPFSRFNIINQAPMVGIAAIAERRIAAHADFCPMSEYMEFNGTGRMIFCGSETKIPYLHGAVVRGAFAKRYPAIVTAYCEAVTAADQWIKNNPLHASRMLAKWTMIPRQVLYLYFSHGGYLIPDPTIKPQWLKTLRFDHSILAKYAGAPPLKMAAWVDPAYLKAAYKKLGLNYEKQEKRLISPMRNIGRPSEIWVNGVGIKKFSSVPKMIEGYLAATKSGKKVSAAYVYDHDTGIKMFARTSWFVESPTAVYAYMTLNEAKKAAASEHGKVCGFAKLLSPAE